MKKRVLIGFIILSSLLFISFNNISSLKIIHSEMIQKFKEKEEIINLEAKVGLEHLLYLNTKKMSSTILNSDEYISARKTKINVDILNKDVIYKIIERNKYLTDIQTKKAPDLPYKFMYMDTYNNIDKLGYVLPKELGLNLLDDLLKLGSLESLATISDNDDLKIYQLNYLFAMLQDYFINSSDFSQDEANLIVPHLINFKLFSNIYILGGYNKTLQEDEINVYKDSINFLSKIN